MSDRNSYHSVSLNSNSVHPDERELHLDHTAIVHRRKVEVFQEDKSIISNNRTVAVNAIASKILGQGEVVDEIGDVVDDVNLTINKSFDAKKA
jgi:hypothetical protein